MNKKIKSIKSIRLINRIDSIYDEEIQIREVPASLEFYDENGRIIEETNYSASGDLNEKYQYFYNKNNFIIKKNTFLTKDEIAEEKNIERDEKGNILSYQVKYMDGSIDIANYQYENELLRQILVKDEDDEISLKHEFNYDENLNLIWEKKQDEFGFEYEITRVYSDKLLTKEVKKLFREEVELESNYVYGANKQLIEKKTKADNGIVFEHVLNEYDSENRNIKSIIIDDNAKTIVYNKFDKDSNEITQYAEDENGNRIHRIEREFENGLLMKSNVEIYGPENRLQTKYSVIKKYEFYDV